MKKSKIIIWFYLILLLFILVSIYLFLDNKEGMNLEKTCVNNICVPKTKNCLSKPDGSYNCT
jgi:hypothetical protein